MNAKAARQASLEYPHSALLVEMALSMIRRALSSSSTDCRASGQVSVAFARAAKRAGVLDFRFHDLRHTAASWLRMQGADIHTVAQIPGHKDLRMAARYQHLSPAFMAEAVSRLGVAFDLQRHLSVTEQKC